MYYFRGASCLDERLNLKLVTTDRVASKKNVASTALVRFLKSDVRQKSTEYSCIRFYFDDLSQNTEIRTKNTAKANELF